MEADTLGSAPAEGRTSTAPCRDAGPARPTAAAGNHGRCSGGRCGTARASPAGGGAGRGRPRPPSPAEGGREGRSEGGQRTGHPRGAAASPRLARCRRRPLGSAPGAAPLCSALLGGTGAASPPARPSFPWQTLAAGSAVRAATPAPLRPGGERSAQPARPRPRRVNKVAVGRVEEENCPGGSGSRGSGLSAGLGAGGRCGSRLCTPFPPPVRSRSLPGNRRCPPKEATGAPAPLPLAHSHTSHRHTHT